MLRDLLRVVADVHGVGGIGVHADGIYQDGVIDLGEVPGFGMEVIDDPAAAFPYVDGPGTLPNPRFPHALERAQKREQAVVGRYAS